MFRRPKSPGETAKSDQERAAIEENGRVFSRLSGIDPKSTVQQGGIGQEWARLVIADRLTLQSRNDPELTTCGHLTSPQPTFLPSWAKHMSCQACVTSLPKATDEEDLTCDRCRVYPKQTYIAIVRAGQYTVLGGLCGECREQELED
jgi:hypothetical protein